MLINEDLGDPSAGDWVEDLTERLTEINTKPFARVLYKAQLSGSDAVNEGQLQIFAGGVKQCELRTVATGEDLHGSNYT